MGKKTFNDHFLFTKLLSDKQIKRNFSFFSINVGHFLAYLQTKYFLHQIFVYIVLNIIETTYLSRNKVNCRRLSHVGHIVLLRTVKMNTTVNLLNIYQVY